MNITYSVSNWIYGEEPFEKQFERLKKYNYDAIELMVIEPVEFAMRKIKNLIEVYNLPCSSICTMMNYSEKDPGRRNLIDKNVEVRKRTIQYLKDCLNIGAELNANLLLTVPSGVANVKDEWSIENRDLCIDAIR